MTNAPIKTVPTKADVLDFLASLENQQQQKDSETIIELMQKISNEPPTMWGPSIIGFGKSHYKYESGREGDMPNIAFSPRKGKLTLYITYDVTKYTSILNRLGKHKTSKGCIYVTKLSDVDMAVFEELILEGYKNSKKEHPSS